MIRTLLGDIEPQMLGHCQCHEHIFIEKGVSYGINPVLWMDDEALSTQELNGYKRAGGSAIVDAQPMYFGRMAAALERASASSGIHILAVTGFHKLIFCETDAFPATASEESLTAFFISEVQRGVLSENGRRIRARAGAIKAAVDTGGIRRDSCYERLFHAAANAAVATGAPVMVHMEKGTDAFEVLGFFETHGLRAERLILCHLDRMRPDAEYHRELLSTGVYLDYDSINRMKYVGHTQELELILRMTANGYASQLLLSLDTTRARMTAYGGTMGLDYILTEFMAMLQNAGVSEQDIAAMTRQNAARVLRMVKADGR